MVDACHARGIRVPIYTTVQWDRYSWDHNPAWRLIRQDGRSSGHSPLAPGFYQTLNVGNKGYRDFLKAHVKDVFNSIGTVDGLFFDILWAQEAEDCSFDSVQQMRNLGFRPEKPEDRAEYGRRTVESFVREMFSLVKELNPLASVYFNNASLSANNHEHAKWFTHLEFDALPGSSPTGYDHLPVRGRFERNLHACVGQTGKFHTGWGDFNSYKNRASLEFECFHFLALNVRCLIGDQLPPSGKIDPEVYKLIGSIYSQVEAVEPWCTDALPIVDIAVLSGNYDETQAIVRMLQEGGFQFDVVDDASDFSGYSVLILTDSTEIGKLLETKIGDFLNNGGKVLASFESGLDSTKSRFLFPHWGVIKTSEGPIDSNGQLLRGRVDEEKHEHTTFFRPKPSFACGLSPVDFVMYSHDLPVESVAGAALADSVSPFFFRENDHYCSHMHTPSSGVASGVALNHTENVVYFSHPIWRIYSEYSPIWVKRAVLSALRLLLPNPVLKHDGPSTLIATINRQAARSRSVVHLLHYIPERRATRLEIIEDVIPLYSLTIFIREDVKIQRVTLEPSGTELPFDQTEGYVRFVVPKVDGHQLIVLA